MSTPPRKGTTRLIVRLHALLEALQEGTLTLTELGVRLGAAYGSPQSLRRMLDRDRTHLAALGIVVERHVNPLRYTLCGGLPTYTAQELRTLALFRDTFDARHPQAVPILALLDRLTTDLPPAARRDYERRAVRRAPVRPAIDYSPYLACIETLERAIAIRQPVSFRYHPTSGHERRHAHVEPYEIEFYERHFYLVGYTTLHGQIRDFRIDRISDLSGLEQRMPPGSERDRPMVLFRYRLVAALAQGEISQRFEAQRVVERLPNGDVIIEAQGRSAFFIIQTLLRYRNNAELLWPPELRAHMAAEVRGLAELYAGDMLQ